MKKYERLFIETDREIDDVVTCSAEVTTEEIEIPWGQGAASPSSASYDL